MKKIYTLCLAAAMIFAASCTPMDTTDGDSNPPIGSQRPIIMKSYVITATKDAETKITVDDNDGSALWEEGDVIRVYNANEAWDVKGYEATMTSGAGTTSATFEFDAPADRNEGFFVVYGTTATLADGELNIEVPSEVATSAKPILAGYTATKDEIGAVDLKAVTAYLKITLNDEVESVRFFAVNNPTEKLAGTVVYTKDGITTDGIKTVPDNAQVLVTNPSEVFYVNLLPGTLSQGYIIDVQNEGAHMIKSVSYDSEYTNFAAGSFGKLTIPTFAAATVSGTVSPVTTYTKRENDLSKRLKIYGASTSAVAVSGLSEALASHVELAGYSCEGKTSTNGVFSDDFAIGSHTVTATYNFHCGDVTIPVTSTATGTAVITGLPLQCTNRASYAGWTVGFSNNTTNTYSMYNGQTATSPEFNFVGDVKVSVSIEPSSGTTGTFKCNDKTIDYKASSRNLDPLVVSLSSSVKKITLSTTNKGSLDNLRYTKLTKTLLEYNK